MSVLNVRRGLGLSGLLVAMFAATALPGLAANDPADRCDGVARADAATNAAVIDLAATPNAQGTNGDDVIFGTDGDDVINGNGGDDVICGFAGSDTIDGGTGNDTVYGGDGDDTISGGDGHDTLYGEAGKDEVDGDAGEDSLFGGGDSDSMDGGSGDDLIYGGEDSSTATTTDTQGGPVAAAADAGTPSGSDTIEGGQGNDIIFGGDDDDTIDGGAGNDQLSGDGGNDHILGGDGDDGLFGESGNDNLEGGAGDDQLYGDGGVDVLAGQSGNDRLFGGDNNDALDGGDGHDQVSGEAGDDQLRGGDGDDSLFGGDGGDRLNGGDGNDVVAGGSGNDTLDYSDAPGPVKLDLGAHSAGGGGGSDAPSGIEVVEGSAFGDQLTGDAQNDTLDGNGGDDTIDGGLGDDTENGGDGNDTFNQGDARNGADKLSGGPGTDSVDYSARANPVNATRDGVADDGEAGEGDNMRPDVEGALTKPRAIAPLTQAPALAAPSITRVRANTTFISPNHDGRLDALKVSAAFSRTTTWTFEVLSGASDVYVDTGRGSSMRATWNGRTGLGQRAVSGDYAWRVTTTDAAGNAVAVRTGAITVDRLHPRLRGLHVRGTRAFMAVSEASTISAQIRKGGKVVRRFAPVTLKGRGNVAIGWNGRDERNRPARPGAYRMVITVRDLAGNLTVKTVTIRV